MMRASPLSAIVDSGNTVKNPCVIRARMGVRAGRLAYLSGRIPKKAYASASSPLEGVVR